MVKKKTIVMVYLAILVMGLVSASITILGNQENKVINLQSPVPLANATYGEMFNHSDDGFTITVTDITTYFNISMRAGDLNKVAFAIDNVSLIIQEIGIYKLSWTGAFGDGGNQEFQIAAILNGMPQEDCETHRKTGTGGDVGSISGTCIISLAVNDMLNLGIKNVNPPASDAIIFAANLNVHKLETLQGGGGGASTFLALSDTPGSYAGQGGNCLIVNVGETAVGFGSCGGGVPGNFFFKNFTSSFDTNYTAAAFSYNQSLNVPNNSLFLSINNITDFLFNYNQSENAVMSNIFDQDLNTTSNVAFNEINTTGNINISKSDPEFHITSSGGDGGEIFFVNPTGATPGTWTIKNYLGGGRFGIFRNGSNDFINVSLNGNVDIHNNLSASYFFGNGSQLTRVFNDLLDVDFDKSQNMDATLFYNESSNKIEEARNPADESIYSWQFDGSTGIMDWIVRTETDTIGTVVNRGDTVDPGDKMAIRDNDLNFTSYSDGELGLSADGDIKFYGNTTYNTGANTKVTGDSWAFQGETAGEDEAGLWFEGDGLSSRFVFFNTDGNAHMNISAIGTGGRTYTWVDKLIVGGNEISTQGRDLASGDVNASIVYADAHITKSPIVLGDNNMRYVLDLSNFFKDGFVKVGLFEVDSNHSILQQGGDVTQRMIDKLNSLSSKQSEWNSYITHVETCEARGEHYTFISFDEFKLGSKDCSFNQELGDKFCQEQFDKFYRYNQGSGKCERDKASYCESVDWQYWKGEQCNVNTFRECIFNGFIRNQSWTGSSCEFDVRIECINRGDGWSWNGKECKFDSVKKIQKQYEKCLKSGRGGYWNGEQCVEL